MYDYERNYDSVGYATLILSKALLPCRDPKIDTLVVERGGYVYTLHADVGIPYGRYSRLILAYLTTQAYIRSIDSSIPDKEKRTVPLGRTFNDFLRNIGIATPGRHISGRTRSLARDHLDRVTSLTVTLKPRYACSPTEIDKVLFAISKRIHWDDGDQSKNRYCLLDEDFYREAAGRGVPFDLRIINKLSQPSAFDFYMWATYNVFTQSPYGGTMLTWTSAKHIFGTDYKDDADGRKNFKRRFRQTVNQVAEAWPKLEWTATQKGIYLPSQDPSVTATVPHREQIRRELGGE